MKGFNTDYALKSNVFLIAMHLPGVVLSSAGEQQEQ